MLARLFVRIRRWRRRCLLICRISNGFVFGKDQVELIKAFRRRAKPVPVVARKLVLQLLDQQRLRLNLTHQ